VRIQQGLVPEVLSTIDCRQINFLHIDLNAAKPEVEALRYLIPQLAPGCTVILDDYGFPEFTSSRLAHQELAKEFNYQILSLPTGQGVIQF
jgi:hypothetical protein